MGTSGCYAVTHRVVPTSLIVVEADPRTCCGWQFGSGTAFLIFDGALDASEACEKCLPGIARWVSARQTALAREVAAARPHETPILPGSPGRSRSPRRGH